MLLEFCNFIDLIELMKHGSIVKHKRKTLSFGLVVEHHSLIFLILKICQTNFFIFIVDN